MKIIILLLILVSALQVKSGQRLKDCISSKGHSYDSLLSLVNNANITRGDILKICCAGPECLPMTTTPCSNGFGDGNCIKIAQNVFCAIGPCGGIIGDAQITSNITMARSNSTTISMCPDLDSVANKVREIAKEEYQAVDSVMCNWDNGGWTCYNEAYYASNIYCLLQWVAPPPAGLGINIDNPSSSGGISIILIAISASLGFLLLVAIIVIFYYRSQWKKFLEERINSTDEQLSEVRHIQP
ncbi:hypothetical protein RCL_jg23507.t1 [Rhizophagus clarus]|uniref:LysM domain-containing protein n=1 Tax=Rhizophagus clarus TaxID=94130 RepID=A0A8H3L5Y3_9GLOM|nr:hypothetical protein RCL_jg23507.t1 [Rhizophagus clarus]